MRELSFTEYSLVQGGGFWTGVGVFLVFAVVSEISSDVQKLLRNSYSCPLILEELTQTQAKLQKYQFLYGELP